MSNKSILFKIALAMLFLVLLLPSGLAQDNKVNQQLIDIGEKLEKTLMAKDQSFFDQHFDKDKLVSHLSKGIKIDGPVQTGFLKGVKNSTDFGKVLVDEVKKGGSVKFLKVHRIENQDRILLRLITENGVNYWDLIVEKNKDNGPKVGDIYFYLAGEKFSKTMRRLFLITMSANKAGGKDDIPEEDKTFFKHIKKFKKVTTLLKEGKHRQAYIKLKELPKSIQKMKVMRGLKVQITSNLKEKEYLAAMEEYQKAFPKDPSVELISIDAYFLSGKYDKAIQCIENLHREVTDPYLYSLKSTIYLSKKDIKNATKSAQQCIKMEPGLEDGYWSLLDPMLAAKDHSGTVEVMTTLEKKFNAEFGDLTKYKVYADFVASEEFKKWMAAKDK